MTSPEPDQTSQQGGDQQHKTKTNTTSKSEAPRREASVLRRLVPGTTTERSIIPGQVYDLLNEIVTFTFEVEDKARQKGL